MLTFGPFKYRHGELYDCREGEESGDDWIPAENANIHDVEICKEGLEKVFQNIERTSLIEFRIYNRRPKGNAIEAELRIEQTDGILENLEIACGKDEFERTTVQLIEDEIVCENILDEFGIDLNELNSDEIHIYYAYVRAVIVGKAPVEIYDWDVNYNGEQLSLTVFATTDVQSTITLKLKDFKWKAS